MTQKFAPRGRLARVSLTVCVLALLLMGLQHPTRAASETGLNQYERDAINVVRAWTTAFSDRDVQKAASYMADDVEFRRDPSNPTFFKGRDAVVKAMQRLVDLQTGTTIERIDAVGGPKEVLVIVRRTNKSDRGGQTNTSAVGYFYRVDPQTQKIDEWLTAPLMQLGNGTNLSPSTQEQKRASAHALSACSGKTVGAVVQLDTTEQNTLGGPVSATCTLIAEPNGVAR